MLRCWCMCARQTTILHYWNPHSRQSQNHTYNNVYRSIMWRHFKFVFQKKRTYISTATREQTITYRTAWLVIFIFSFPNSFVPSSVLHFCRSSICYLDQSFCCYFCCEIHFIFRRFIKVHLFKTEVLEKEAEIFQQQQQKKDLQTLHFGYHKIKANRSKRVKFKDIANTRTHTRVHSSDRVQETMAPKCVQTMQFTWYIKQSDSNGYQTIYYRSQKSER